MISEKDLENYLVTETEDGFNIWNAIKEYLPYDEPHLNDDEEIKKKHIIGGRQLNISPYGIIDIFLAVRFEIFNNKHKKTRIHVVFIPIELKITSFQIDYLVQLSKYESGIANFLKKKEDKNFTYNIFPVLLCRMNKGTDDVYMLNSMSHAWIYTILYYDVTLDNGFTIIELDKGGWFMKDDYGEKAKKNLNDMIVFAEGGFNNEVV